MIGNVFRVGQKARTIFPRTLQPVRTCVDSLNDFSDSEGLIEDSHYGVGARRQTREKCVNKVTLLGRVGKDPSSTERMTTFPLATNETFFSKALDEEVNKTYWHQIQVTRLGLKEIVDRSVGRGDRVLVNGSLRYYKFQDRETGNDINYTSIMADDIVFLSKKRDNAS